MKSPFFMGDPTFDRATTAPGSFSSKNTGRFMVSIESRVWLRFKIRIGVERSVGSRDEVIFRVVKRITPKRLPHELKFWRLALHLIAIRSNFCKNIVCS